MEDNVAFIEGDLLEEIAVDDNPGPSHRREGEDSEHKHAEDYVKKESVSQAASALNDVEQEDEDEFEEEDIQGQIIQGEDGEYYLLMDDDGADVVEVDDDPSTVESQLTADGEEQLIFQSNPVNPLARDKRVRPARAIVQETEGGPVEMIQFTDMPDDDEGGPQLDLAVGAIQTAEASDDHMQLHHHNGMVLEPMPGGLKMRRSRVYGTCRCEACGQSFVNTARLERHLAVHQVFGSFLCPLCGKTYKYEYNLFYHWRRTCRDLNELMSQDDRKSMDVNALRALVDEVAAKKQEYGPIEIGISRSVLFQSGPLARLEMPANPLGRRGTTCRACGVVVHFMHLAHHLNLHKGLPSAMPDQRSAVGGFYCDLCGLLFRQQYNLIKHWRTNCAEIQANLPEEVVDLTLDDGQLRDMVCELLKRASTSEAILDAETHRLKVNTDGMKMRAGEHVDVVGEFDEEDLGDDARRERERDEAEAAANRDYDDRGGGGGRSEFNDEPGAVYADDFEDDEVHLLGEEAIGAGGTIANRAKWNMNGAPIQCSECFRSFANHGRLERHMAGFHASHGSHHCALCGNRFKYDYNLLYHYRKSCPYTKSYIDKDVRDQMDAANLRKLVRSLAQKDLKLTPQTRPMQRLPKQPTHQSNDAIIRREMMRPILASAPAVLTQPRRGMNGKQCPVCSIMFYNRNAIERHMSLRHGLSMPPGDYDYDEDEEDDLQHHYAEEEQQETVAGTMRASKTALGAVKKVGGAPGVTRGEVVEAVEEDEAPPTLEIQQPGEQVMQKQPQQQQQQSARSRFVSTSSLSGQYHHTTIAHHHGTQFDDVQEMYERGEIKSGDVIYVREGDHEVEYTVNDDALEDMEGEGEGEGEEEGGERDEEAEEAAAYAAEQKMRRIAAARPGPSHQQQQQQQRRFPAGGPEHHQAPAGGGGVARPSSSASAAAAAARKRPREASIWDDDLLEEDEEMAEMQREVNQRRAEDAARGGSVAPRGRHMPAIMHRRGV